jgi:hypothetical protein
LKKRGLEARRPKSFLRGKILTDGQQTLVVIAFDAVVWWLMIEGIIKVFSGG